MTQRYELIEGNPIWIIDRVFSYRNPLFGSGIRRSFARRFLRNLNNQPQGGE